MATDDVRALAAKLLRLAEQATPGPWEWRDNQSMYAVPGPVVEGSGPPRRYPYGASVLHGAWEYDSGSWIEAAADADREYIAAANPEAVTALARAVLAQETRPTCATCQYFNEHDNECYVSGHVTPDHFCGYHVPAPPDQPREDEA